MGLGVCIWDAVFVQWMGCLYTGWSVSKRVRVLVTGMGCNFPGWGVSKRDGVLLSGMGC